MADDGINWDFPLSGSTEGRLLTAVLNRVKQLQLNSIQPDNIVIRKLPWLVENDTLKMPCVLVSPAAEITNWQDGTNEADRPQLGIFVTIILATQRDLVKGIGLQVYWRQQIRQAFQNLSVTRFTEWPTAESDGFMKASVDSGDKFIDAAFKGQRDAQYLLLRFTVKEGRKP